MLMIGFAIGLPTIGWVLTDGPEGTSPILMRGGALGFWLSVLTAAELIGLGLVMVSSRPPSSKAGR
jgi:hypothetical protein